MEGKPRERLEARWLIGKIMGDGQVDKVEKALLAHLAAHNALPEELSSL